MKKEALNIDRFLTLIETKGYQRKVGVRNRIYRIGIELEGGWDNLPSGCELVRDSSVKIAQPVDPLRQAKLDTLARKIDRATTNDELYRLRREYEQLQLQAQQRIAIGELPSEPMEPEKLPVWMKKFYPQHMNETCGLHVHMSFQSAYHYARLMIPAYPLTIVKYLTDWAMKEGLDEQNPIWDRLAGKSEYCQPVFDPDRQARKSKKEYDHHAAGNRYSMVSYQWARLGTIEVRLLPMMTTAEQGIRAVQRVLDITNGCLACQKEKEPKLRSNLVIDPTDTFRAERVEMV